MVQPKEKTENEENHKGKVSGMDAAMAHRERKQLNFSTIVDFPSQNRVSFLSHSDKKDPQLRLRVLFCAGAGRIRTGRPSADGKKQSCGLFFRPRLRSVYKELHADRETGC